jgi:S1-C subfamily serine protease
MKKLLAVSIFLAGFIAILSSQYQKKQETFALSTLKIITSTGHGSGVHIGNGYILTAAHVVDGSESIRVRATHNGEEPAELLWLNKAHDVDSSPLSCKPLGVGQSVKATGNPGPLEFITSWGRVSSYEAKRGNWKSSIIVDLTIAPGSSGGPVFDTRGNVVGLVVGIALMSHGFSSSAIPYSYVVPGSAICSLLARNSS